MAFELMAYASKY